MHGYDYRAGSSGAIPHPPPGAGHFGPPAMGHMVDNGNLPPNCAPDRMYQPPPPGLEAHGHALPQMGGPLGMEGSRAPGMNDVSGMISSHENFMTDNVNINQSTAASVCGLDDTSMMQRTPHEPSGYTLTCLDTTSPMGSES